MPHAKERSTRRLWGAMVIPMKIFRIIILFLFFSNNAWSYGNLVGDPWVSKFEYEWMPKFDFVIDEALYLKSLNADWYFIGFHKKRYKDRRTVFGESIYLGFLNEKSKNMLKTPVYTGKRMRGGIGSRFRALTKKEYKRQCTISAHHGDMKKYFNYEKVKTKPHSVPLKDSCSDKNKGTLPIPMRVGWIKFGDYDLYFDNNIENIRAMFRAELINFDQGGILTDRCGARNTINYLQCANYEIGKMLEEIRGQDSTQVASTNNQTQDNTKTTTTSSKIDINLSYWQEISKEKKLELIESYFFKILKVKAQTTEEKNSLIEMSNNIIKCVDSLNLNISIGKAIGQCL